MAADDLAAADAIGVGEHDVESLDFGMGVEKGLAPRRGVEPDGEVMVTVLKVGLALTFD